MVVRVRGFLRGVLSGWVELNFDDDVEGIKSGQSLGNSGRNQRKDRSQRNNHRPVVIRIGKIAIGPFSECGREDFRVSAENLSHKVMSPSGFNQITDSSVYYKLLSLIFIPSCSRALSYIP